MMFWHAIEYTRKTNQIAFFKYAPFTLSLVFTFLPKLQTMIEQELTAQKVDGFMIERTLFCLV